MRYSSGMKLPRLKRILPPNSESIFEVSRETGVNKNTIYYWKKQAAEGMLGIEGSEIHPRDRTPGEKLTIVLEGKTVSSEERGEWPEIPRTAYRTPPTLGTGDKGNRD